VDRGVTARAFGTLSVMARVARARSEIGEGALARFDDLESAIEEQCTALEAAEPAA
jgi:16S rRNA G527 N7-methylase RsmG